MCYAFLLSAAFKSINVCINLKRILPLLSDVDFYRKLEKNKTIEVFHQNAIDTGAQEVQHSKTPPTLCKWNISKTDQTAK